MASEGCLHFVGMFVAKPSFSPCIRYPRVFFFFGFPSKWVSLAKPPFTCAPPWNFFSPKPRFFVASLGFARRGPMMFSRFQASSVTGPPPFSHLSSASLDPFSPHKDFSWYCVPPPLVCPNFIFFPFSGDRPSVVSSSLLAPSTLQRFSQKTFSNFLPRVSCFLISHHLSGFFRTPPPSKGIFFSPSPPGGTPLERSFPFLFFSLFFSS